MYTSRSSILTEFTRFFFCKPKKGDFVCVQCRTVNPNLEEEGANEEAFTQKRKSIIGSNSSQKRKEKMAKIHASSSRPWLSVEALHAIYQGCLVEGKRVFRFKKKSEVSELPK